MAMMLQWPWFVKTLATARMYCTSLHSHYPFNEPCPPTVADPARQTLYYSQILSQHWVLCYSGITPPLNLLDVSVSFFVDVLMFCSGQVKSIESVGNLSFPTYTFLLLNEMLKGCLKYTYISGHLWQSNLRPL